MILTSLIVDSFNYPLILFFSLDLLLIHLLISFINNIIRTFSYLTYSYAITLDLILIMLSLNVVY